MQSGLARAHFLSPTGQCQPFEAEADGYSRAEGCAMFVLKRLRDAVADNDRILGVIKGSGINQSGNAKSITHPHADTQKRLFEQVFKCSQVIPQTINVVEAHGTGTQAGDPIEFESISKGLASGRSTSNPLYITSVKGNIGHAEAASGSAGLIKLLKMMESETIPPQASLDTLNPKIQALKTDKVIIPMEKTSWVTPQARPRRALLNNFGAAGSNACLILEEWVSSSHASSTAPLRDSYVFALSAKDKPAFTRSRNALIESLKGNTSRHSIQHLSYTSLRRPLMDVRLLVTANSSHQLLKILQDPATQPVEQTQQLHKTNRIAFVFSGQGSQYIGMAKYLFDTVPAFSNDIHSCNKILLSLGRPSILPVLEGAISIEKTTLSAMHCAVFAIQYGLSRLWTSWGVRPTATFGHSLGEYAAMVTAEVISVADALAILSYRAELIEELCEVGKSCMIAVKASAAEVDEILQSRQLKLEEASLACDNSPGDCVITTSIAVLDKVMSTFADHGVKTRKLDMPFGYHSSRMEVLRGRLDKFTSRIWLRKPAIPLGLGLDGRILGKDDELDHRYFSSQAISPVRFRELVQNYESRSKQQNDIFLEIGPHPVLLPAIRASKLSSTPAAFIQSLNKKKGDWPSLIESSAELARQGVQLQWRKHFQEEDSTLVEMPLYQFADTEFMPPIKPRRIAEAVNPGVKMASNPEISPFLSAQKLNSTTGEMLYTASDKILPFVDGHRVTDIALCPASVYLELALQGARHCQKLDNSYSVRNIVFSAPILRQGQDPLRPIEVAIEGCHGFCDSIGFKINYSNATQTSTVSCCHGYLLPRKNDGTETSLISERIQRTMEKHRMGRNSEHPTIIRRKMLYESIFTRVVSYSSTYQTIDWLQMSDNGQEGWGSFRLRPGAMFNGCVSQPVFVDTLLHAAGFIANCYVKSSEVCICTHVERFDMIGGANIDYGEPFTLYSQIDYTDTKVIGDSYAFTPDGTLVAFIRGVEFKRLSRETFSRSLNLALKSSSQKGSVETTSKQQVTTDIPIREKPKRAKTTESIPKAKSIHLSLLDIIQDVTGISDVNAIESGTFANVGIDSLMMTELCERLRREFPSLSETGESEMAHCETLTELEAILENAIRADDTPSTTDESQPSSSGRESPITDESVTDEDLGASTHNLKSQTDEKRSSATSLKKPVLLQKGSSSAAPLYLIHDGSGMCSMYSRISRLNRDVFGIAAGDNAAPQSVSDMAQKYLTLIDTCEPIILAGWSFGGVVAYEMARILRSRNQAVAGLVIIDSPCPTDHKGLPDAALQNICIGKPAWLLRNFQIHAAALGAFQPNISQGSLDVPVILLQSKDLVEIESSCGGYAPFLDDASERNRNVQLWKQLLKQNASVLKIPGHHFQAFDENVVGETSVSLAMAIREIEQAQ